MNTMLLSNLDWIVQAWSRVALNEIIFSILLFLVIWPLSRLVKSRSSYWHLGLWLLIYLRIIIPADFSMSTSIWQIVDRIRLELPGIDDLHATEWFLDPEADIAGVNKDAATMGKSNSSVFLKWMPYLLFYSWSIIVFLQFQIYLKRKLYFNRIIRRAEKIQKHQINDLVNFWSAQFKIKREVQLFSSTEFSTPFTSGVFRPGIFIPVQILKNDDQSIVNAAIAHEMVHIRRLDALWMIFQTAINILFFFLPTIWYASRELNRSREQICDSMVLKSGLIEPVGYAGAIIETLRFNLSGFSNINLMPAFITNKQIMQQRIKLIMENKSMKRKEIIILTLSVITLAFSVLPMSNIVKASEPIVNADQVPVNAVGIDSQFRIPIEAGVVSSRFGMRIHPILKENRMHTGIDIAAPKGTEVYAASSGKVISAQMDGAWGNRIIIVHDDNYRTFYGQLSEFHVNKGDAVKAGQLIGEVGSSGLSTAPHLHFEIRKNNQPVDPQSLVDFSELEHSEK